MPRSFKWSFSIRRQNQILCALLFCHTPRPPHPSSYGHPNNIVEKYKLWNQTPYAIFSSRLLLPPSEAKHPPQHPTLHTLSFRSSINAKTKRPTSTSTQNNNIFTVTQKAGTYQLGPCPCYHGMTLPQAADGRDQWRTEGKFGVFKPPPPEIPKALQNRAKLNPICENC